MRYVEKYDKYVTKQGLVFRYDKKKDKLVECKQSLNKQGYARISYGRNHKLAVHRLVALAFIPNPENKPCVDHIDRDVSNNDVSNLRWATYHENNSNTICVENEIKLYGVRYCEDRKAYDKAYYAKNREDYLERDRERRARKKALKAVA